MSERERGRKTQQNKQTNKSKQTNNKESKRREKHWRRRPGREKRGSGVGGGTVAASKFPNGTWSCCW